MSGRMEYGPGVADQAGAQRQRADGDNFVASAYFRDVVDATDVTTVPSEREEADTMRRRQRRYLMIGGCACFGIALAIIIPLVTLVGSRASPEVVVGTSSIPTLPPTRETTMAPTIQPIPDAFVFTVDLLRQMENTTIMETNGWWNNRSSAPYQAANWLSQESTTFDNQRLLQRYALATFYFSTTWDQPWKSCRISSGGCPKEPWLSSGDECNWGFVSCDSLTGTVTELNFPAFGNDLHGTLPPQLSLLSGLQVFAISNNHVMGGMVTIHRENDTIVTNITNSELPNHLHAIDQAFYALTSLRVLTLYGNDFTGSLPTRMWNTNPGLTTAILGRNRFEGSIPDEISGATSLQDLQIQHNMITGSLPESLGRLSSSLTSLQLKDNHLMGSLPSQLFALTQLTSLDITNNTQLTIDFQTTAQEGFTQLSNLQSFQAAFTPLQSNLPAEIFSSLTAMQVWDTQSASLRGTVPDELSLWNASLRALRLQNNQLTGPLPEALQELTKLEELTLEGNNFTGTISETICGRKGNKFGELEFLTVGCSISCNCCDDAEEECV